MIGQLIHRLFGLQKPEKVVLPPSKRSSMILRLQQSVAHAEVAHHCQRPATTRLQVTRVCGVRRLEVATEPER